MQSISILLEEGHRHYQALRYVEAEASYRRAVSVNSSDISAWYHLGLACAALDNLECAMEAFRSVLALSPNDVESFVQIGIILAKQDQLTQAVAHIRRAIELNPSHAKAHNNVGVALTRLGRMDEGIICYRQAVSLQPNYAEAHFNLGVAFADRDQADAAIESYRAALRARPDYTDALINLGLLLVQERMPADAVQYLEQAARLKPGNPEAHNNLSLAFADLGRFEDAVASCDEALRLRPLDAKSHMNRGNALSSLGRFEEAIACYDLAIRLQPDYSNAHWNRSLAWLAYGDFESGWPEYEWRWRRAESKEKFFRQPRWDGNSPDGKTILLWCEQGVGDTIQFVRYASTLKDRGATVWLQAPEKLIPLLSTCQGIARVFPEGTPSPSEFDVHAPLMSLPLLCGTTLNTIPSINPYLSADSKLIEQWQQELAKSAHMKIGIAWQGNPKHRFDQHRSLSLHWFQTLADIEGIELYSLQKGFGTEQIKAARFPIHDLGSRLDERSIAFEDTAAVMHALDLVITCDTALGHLAGALGTRTWIALSSPADWRWLQEVEDTPWYSSVRLFRQSKLGEWGAVFERMRGELVKLRDLSMPSIQVEIAPGELFDKLSILQIKTERISDAEKLRNVHREIAAVETARRKWCRDLPGANDLLVELKQVNELLWDIENRIREHEQKQDFGSEFVALARSVYQTNDRRAAIKQKLNKIAGARFREEKEYSGEPA